MRNKFFNVRSGILAATLLIPFLGLSLKNPASCRVLFSGSLSVLKQETQKDSTVKTQSVHGVSEAPKKSTRKTALKSKKQREAPRPKSPNQAKLDSIQRVRTLEKQKR
jgi:hypothetical protein